MKFTLGAVFGLAFTVLGRRIGPLMAMTAIVYVALYFVCLFISLAAMAIFRMTGTPIMDSLPALNVFLPIAALWSAVTDIALSHAADKPVRIGSLLRNCFANTLPVLLIGALWAIAVAMGAILLVVPALVFVAVFQVPVPVYISEKPGIFGAFARSRALTHRRRWAIFGLNLLVSTAVPLLATVGAMVVALGGSAIFPRSDDGGLSGGETLLMFLFLLGGFLFLSLFIPLLNAATYVALRADKGDPLSGAVAKIFE